MKQAKLMVSAIAIFAVCGAAFAFQAKKFDQNVIFTGTKGSGVCTVQVQGAKIAPGTANVAASTTSLTSGCLDVFTTTTID